MKIDTDEWLPVIDAGRLAGLDKSTALRLARSLGIAENFFGVNVVRKSDVATLEKNRRSRGNPRWVESWEGAAADGSKGGEAAKKTRMAKRSPRP
jgi:hypothetical protein